MFMSILKPRAAQELAEIVHAYPGQLPVVATRLEEWSSLTRSDSDCAMVPAQSITPRLKIGEPKLARFRKEESRIGLSELESALES